MVRDRDLIRYHIGTVAKLTGLSTHTIRVWERRYSAVVPLRSEGGTREYTPSDVEKLILLGDLTRSGWTIGKIARLDYPDLLEIRRDAEARGMLPENSVAGNSASQHRRIVERFLDRVGELDANGAEACLTDAARLIAPLPMVFDVIAPIVQEVGKRWSSGQFRIANEHAATAVLRTFLGNFISGQANDPHADTALAVTLPDEHHELGALMASFVAVTRGFQVLYLGPNLPPEEINHVAQERKVSLVMVSLVNPISEGSVAALSELVELLGPMELLLGGGAAQAHRDRVSSGRVVTDLRELYQYLEQAALELP